MFNVTKVFDLVCIGHICHDLVGEKIITGGAVYYASREVCIQEKNVCVLTSTRSDNFSLEELENSYVEVRNQGSEFTTCFRNQYVENKRVQFLPQIADRLDTVWILDNLPESRAIFICPIADEIDVEILEVLNPDLLACSIQGWLRKPGENDQVIPKSMDWDKLRYADIVFLSYEDIDGLDGVLDHLCSLDNLIVVTNAEQGADVFLRGKKYHYPTTPVQIKNPTGAGDTFATAFILEYLESENIRKATASGHRAAATIISF